MVSLQYLVFSCILLLKTTVKSEPFYQIGIYSNCSEKTNRTRLNIDAGILSDFYREFSVKNGFPDTLFPYNSPLFTGFVYEEYDVCDNFTYLVEIVQNLSLNERYTIQDGNKSYSNSSIVDIFMHASVEMISFIKSTFTEIPVYDIDYRFELDNQYHTLEFW